VVQKLKTWKQRECEKRGDWKGQPRVSGSGGVGKRSGGKGELAGPGRSMCLSGNSELCGR